MSIGVEFWLARDLQHLLGYGKWDNFQNVISKAKTACELSGQDILDHFADVGKTVDIGSGAQKEIDDTMLTRFACYLIAQNGDPRKEQIYKSSIYCNWYKNQRKQIVEFSQSHEYLLTYTIACLFKKMYLEQNISNFAV